MLSYLANIPVVYQYAAIAVGLLLGGTPALIAAIYLGIAGIVNIWIVGLLCILTTFVWDCIWYVVGLLASYSRFTELISRKISPRSYENFKMFYTAHPLKILFFSRFIYGLSSVITIVSGHLRMVFWKFVFVTEASIVIWFLILVSLGILLNMTAESLEGVVHNIYVILPVFIVVGVVGNIFGRKVFARYIRKNNQAH